ncbi:thermonuclease family protein [Sphingomonas sp. R86521]|uniref:thermonuclease family protein n=1 Tax=Sphingomonas sp. R86521 TaxID=3093860 RepID=UPI0036D2303C
MSGDRAQPASAEPQSLELGEFACTVEGVHDGDGPIYCLEQDAEGRRIKIRLSGIAAREIDETCRPGQPCPEASAQDARQELLRLTTGRVLQCRREGRSYARTVAQCSIDGVDLACAMIRSGKALRWERYDRERRLIDCRPDV